MKLTQFISKKANFLQFFLLPLFMNTFVILAQEKELNQQQIDSLIKACYFRTTEKDYQLSHKIRQWSQEHIYEKGIYESHANLLWYHGTKYNFDSVNVYIKRMDRFNFLKRDSTTNYKYHYLKGLISNNYFSKTYEALDFYQIALQNIPKLDNDAYLSMKLDIESEIAYCYIIKEQYDEAIDLIKPHLSIIKDVDNRTKRRLYAYLAMAYQFKGQPEKSLPLHQEGIKIAKTEDQITLFKNNITYDYYLNKEYQRAIDSALSIRPLIKKIVPYALSCNSEFLALYYEALENYDQAIFYMEDAISNTKVISELPEFYEKLAFYQEKLGDVELAYLSEKKGKQILDSIRAVELKWYISDVQDKITNVNAISKSNKKTVILVITGIIFLFFLGWIYIYFNRDIPSTKIIQENENLKVKMKQKENKFSAVLYALDERRKRLVGQNEELLRVVETKSPEDFQKVKVTKDLLKDSFDPEAILNDALEDSEHSFFIRSLKQVHPELSKTDLKHCLFLHLGKSLKETAEALHVAPDTVKTARQRAKNKICKRNQSLKAYLATFTLQMN